MNDVALAFTVGENGSISILGFLQALELDTAGSKDMADSLAEHILSVLLRHRASIRTAALHFDVERVGSVTSQEFLQILESLNAAIVDAGEASHRPWSEAQIFDLCEAFTLEDSRRIDYEAVLTSFEVVDSENPALAVRFRTNAPRAADTSTSWWRRWFPA
eukprot:TRINITY_DN15064_c0_g2_i3.p1 TRINITY_DN15064_c0_g2~~TRINITY_DN15064_c0_g2_i3.p1  ORF type:complete len:161 (+),score=28.96 TRINITY_DN15064_c0_g2_i3:136-618(+)